jgi:hypothetical protein
MAVQMFEGLQTTPTDRHPQSKSHRKTSADLPYTRITKHAEIERTAKRQG